MGPFDLLALLLVAATGLGCLNRLTLRLPSALGLLAGALAIALLVLAADPLAGFGLRPWLRQAMLGMDLPELFLGGVLGLLLFAATFQVGIDELRESEWVILILATASVIVSTVVFAYGLYGLARLAGVALPLAWCAVAGAILAPTDAVVVDELLRRVSIPRRLRAAISGESLLNDGAGVVLFVLTLQLAGGGTHLIGHGQVAMALLREGGGGALLGAAAGFATRHLLARAGSGAIALTGTLALVLVTYRLASVLHLSGPVAVVAAGLAFDPRAAAETPEPGGRAPDGGEVARFWLMLHEVLNALLFVLIGLQAVEIPYATIAWLPVLGAVPLAVASRFISIVLPLALTGGSWRDQWRRAAVLTWAGMRGGVSIAMVLATPQTPWRDELVAICLAVVLFTVFGQGLTLGWVLRRVRVA
jgi:monovalent cation:H+ antiporter, CPA1 family